MTMKLFLSAVTLTLLQAVKSAPAELTKGSFELPQGTYPEHTTSTATKNRDGGVTKTYSFPEDSGWKMASGRDLSLEGSVTCTCTSGSGGCNPDQAGNCYMTSCDECTKKNSAVLMKEGGGVGILGSEDDLARNLPSTDRRLFGLELVRDAVKGFNEEFGDSLVMDDDYCPESKKTGVCEAKDGHAFVAVDVFGSTTYVPAKLSGMRAIGASAISAKKLRCSCADGSCPMGSTWGHKYCNADNCQSCTMHGTAIAAVSFKDISPAESELKKGLFDP